MVALQQMILNYLLHYEAKEQKRKKINVIIYYSLHQLIFKEYLKFKDIQEKEEKNNILKDEQKRFNNL